ncbi:SpvB/TcaC N-terminal domain-containing protein [Aliivibrio sifiae]|uniref:SpvB/TcaC N-terminal domain-containing protein n=1 Tax=Aliivibrio sifiae TaxID=566293 RepID=UPI003D11E701
MTQKSTNMAINLPSLPKQGGAISTAQTAPVHAGPTGDFQYSIPCPVTEGRSLTPSLAINYQTSQGNSPFGVGWDLPLMTIRQHTKLGTPAYDDNDRYVGPAGEVLEPERDLDGEVVSNVCDTYGELTLSSHQVIRYRSRVSGGFERYERWRNIEHPMQTFWLVYEPDGSLHCLGKSTAAQTQSNGKIAEWVIEESLSLQGEHVRYVYRSENDEGVDIASGVEKNRELGAYSYLTKVLYANVKPCRTLYCLDDSWPNDKSGWLFSIIFDYGERKDSAFKVPSWSASSPWLLREDSFSDYRYGFEVRSHRLCHQVVLFHHIDGTPRATRSLDFTYDENTTLSQLTSSQVWGYGFNSVDATITESEPAVLFSYQEFDLTEDVGGWKMLSRTEGIYNSNQYQLVDLYGEGLPGILYHQESEWRYRSVQRAEEGGNSIEYREYKTVSAIPSLQGEQTALVDVTGTGRLDWMVTTPGLQGFFSLNDEQEWTSFTPFTAVPAEFFTGEGVFADITGAGLADIAVVGPNSVRFYSNLRGGFSKGKQNTLNDDVVLPVQGRDERTLTAFSDVLGSGQSHLIEASEKSIKCWPNLGRGEFGKVITLLWPGVEENFQPTRLYLVDIDGNGANDLVYAHSNKLTIYRNQSGNGFSDGVDVSLPKGVRFDDTCQLSFSDIKGSGGVSVLLSVPHIKPAHYLLELSLNKSYLMKRLDNQCGAQSEVFYRHSGQEWLDEKADLGSTYCALPLPVYLVKSLRQTDLVTGNYLTQEFSYRHGVYDGKEREFRGFAYVETLDTESTPTVVMDTDIPPLKTCRWYHVGYPVKALTKYWNQDHLSYLLGSTVLEDEEYSSEEMSWIERSLVGKITREEVYGLDKHEFLESNPYTISSYRYKVVTHQKEFGRFSSPVLQVLPCEQLHYNYERVAQDPVCQHSIALSFDEYGLPLHTVDIHYPRRAMAHGVWDNIYLGLDSATEDEQQFVLRLNESFAAYEQVNGSCYSIIGLPLSNRSNVIEGTQADIPKGGFSLENLSVHSLISEGAARCFSGQSKYHYIGESAERVFLSPPRVSYQEAAVFDEKALTAYQEVITPELLNGELKSAGYHQVSLEHSVTPSEMSVWAASQSFIEYMGEDKFYLPYSMKSTSLSGKTTFKYDENQLRVVSTKDALNNEMAMQVSPFSQAPWSVVDINDNTQQVALSPLGFLTYGTFFGSEYGVSTGFNELVNNVVSPENVAELINAAGEVKQLFATKSARNISSWATDHQPLHQVVLTADSYPNNGNQQVHTQVIHSDGFGRALQLAQKASPGIAYSRAINGELAVNNDGHLTEANITDRWQISGRVEYNNKGLVIRQHQPFFADDWRYITGETLRSEGKADTNFYDALGRLTKVVTAKGYERRQYYTPWNTISEDENDTWAEVEAR